MNTTASTVDETTNAPPLVVSLPPSSSLQPQYVEGPPNAISTNNIVVTENRPTSNTSWIFVEDHNAIPLHPFSLTAQGTNVATTIPLMINPSMIPTSIHVSTVTPIIQPIIPNNTTPTSPPTTTSSTVKRTKRHSSVKSGTKIKQNPGPPSPPLNPYSITQFLAVPPLSSSITLNSYPPNTSAPNTQAPSTTNNNNTQSPTSTTTTTTTITSSTTTNTPTTSTPPTARSIIIPVTISNQASSSTPTSLPNNTFGSTTHTLLLPNNATQTQENGDTSRNRKRDSSALAPILDEAHRFMSRYQLQGRQEMQDDIDDRLSRQTQYIFHHYILSQVGWFKALPANVQPIHASKLFLKWLLYYPSFQDLEGSHLLSHDIYGTMFYEIARYCETFTQAWITPRTLEERQALGEKHNPRALRNLTGFFQWAQCGLEPATRSREDDQTLLWSWKTKKPGLNTESLILPDDTIGFINLVEQPQTTNPEDRSAMLYLQPWLSPHDRFSSDSFFGHIYPNIVIPYSNEEAQSDREKAGFNQQLQQNHRRVQRAFGSVKNKFQIIAGQYRHGAEHYNHIFKVCIALQNIEKRRLHGDLNSTQMPIVLANGITIDPFLNDLDLIQ